MFIKARIRSSNPDVLKNKLSEFGIKAEEENGILYIDQEISAFCCSKIKEILDEEIDSEYEFYTKRVFFQKRKEGQ